jgi:hypothetical protein
MNKVSFQDTDSYYSKELDDFYGSKVMQNHSDTISLLGNTGVNFVVDEYREWLMTLLQQLGFNKFEDACSKFPFLRVNPLDDSSSESEGSDDEEQDKEARDSEQDKEAGDSEQDKGKQDKEAGDGEQDKEAGDGEQDKGKQYKEAGDGETR